MKIKKIEQINNETKKEAKRAAIERALKVKTNIKAGDDSEVIDCCG